MLGESASCESKRLERRATAGDSPVDSTKTAPWRSYVSTAGHEKPRGKLGRPRSKAKYTVRPIVNEYREGKVKSTPARGVKEYLKPSVYSQRKRYGSSQEEQGVIACLLKNEPASYASSLV